MAEELSTEADILADMERFASEPVTIKGKEYPSTASKALVTEDSPPKEAPKQEKPSEPEQLPLKEVDQHEAPDSERGTEDRPRDEHGRFLPKEAPPGDAGDVPSPERETTGAEPATPTPETATKPVEPVGEVKDSNYERAKKDAERKDRSWKALEVEKKEAREKIQAERQELARERQRVQEQLARAPKSDIIGYDFGGQPVYSKEALKAAAKAFEDQGDFEKAELARKAIPASEKFEESLAIQAFQQARDRVSQEAIASNPDLVNQQSPLYREMASIYDQEATRAREQNRKPLFEMIPDFMPLAAELAQMRMKVTESDDLRGKLQQALLKIQEQDKLLSVNGSSPTTPRAPKTWETMTTEEQLASMDRMAGFTPYRK